VTISYERNVSRRRYTTGARAAAVYCRPRSSSSATIAPTLLGLVSLLSTPPRTALEHRLPINAGVAAEAALVRQHTQRGVA